MAKPRIFVSSTFIDLQTIRENLENFITSYGYEPVLFEAGEIPFTPDIPTDLACYDEVTACSMLILIIGQKYGSPMSEDSLDNKRDPEDQYQFYKSITEEEVSRATKEGVPTYVFVNNKVLTELDTYMQNRENTDIKYAHVDNVAIFKLIENLRKRLYTQGFSKSEDITDWLRSQWAGEFQSHLIKIKNEKKQSKIESSISELEETLKRLSAVSETLVSHLGVNDPDLIQKLEAEKESSSERMMDIKLKEIDYNAHLLFRHDVDLENIKTAHRLSDTLDDFQKHLRDSYTNLQCGYIRMENSRYYYLEEINRSRDLMGLPLFKFPETLQPLGA